MMDKKGEPVPQDFNFCCKVVVMGNGKAGKSSLIESIVNEDKIDCRKSYFPLFHNKTIEFGGRKYSINIWDSTNSDNASNVNKVYYRDANVILLCYDQQFPERGLTSLEAWYETISQNAQPKCGNKT